MGDAPLSRPVGAATVLDPLTLPLQGARLIEASAGTGKTWTIAALVLRLVLGHGAARAYTPPEILVMTFTRAATRELGERIRARLGEAAAVLRGEQTPADDLMAALHEAFAAGEPRQQAAWRAAQAAAGMDDAAIHTIDAWCQRVLREHALASGSALTETLLADEAALRHEAVRDFWRAQVYALGPDDFATWQAAFADVDRLAHAVSPCLARLAGHGDAGSDDEGDGEGASTLAAVIAERRQALRDLKQGWDLLARAMQTWLMPHVQRTDKAKPFNGNKLKAERTQGWFDALRAWAGSPDQDEPALNEKAWARLTPEGLRDAFTKDTFLDIPPVFDRFQALKEAFEALVPVKARLLELAARAIARRLAELKQRQQVFGFADPLRRLDEALRGPAGEPLRQRLLAQYPVALIDEFQDTSPLQWRVFERLYLASPSCEGEVAVIAGPTRDGCAPAPGEAGMSRPGATLLLIGDPKQSIYGFRGADIYSYLTARAATAGRHHALDTNFRSTGPMVGAINALFGYAEGHADAGAFALGKGHDRSLPFVPVRAQGRPERLVAGDAPVPAVTLCHGPELLAADALRRRYAALAAEQVLAWLGDPRCGFAVADGTFTRLKPADIAVLVRNRTEARAVRHALAQRGVPSVYLSDQASVFDTPEAIDLWRWLQAVADPLDASLARAAFATSLVGLPWAELAAQAQDEAAWDQRVELLRELHRTWQRQGVLAMLRQALHRLDLPARLLGRPAAEGGGPGRGTGDREAGGERSLTNLLHLAELLQGAASGLRGEDALVRWLAERIAEAQGGLGDGAGLGDERIVRLESDEGLLQVVTVHKSKGLEYPVVLLPFASAGPGGAPDKPAVLEVVDDDGRRRLHFAPDDDDRARDHLERLREDLRLFYVALTRARHALWLGVGLQKARTKVPAYRLRDSALGHLLQVTDGMPADAVAGRLQQAFAPWSQRADGVRLQSDVLPARAGRWQMQATLPPLAAAPHYDAPIDRDWAVGSYSSVVRGLVAGPAAGAAAAPAVAGEQPATPAAAVPPVASWSGRLRDELDAERATGGSFDEPAATEAAADAEAPASAPWHRFPRGALPGNFLHDQLEWLAGDGFDRLATEAGQAALRRRCERAGHGERADDVLTWLRAIATAPLPPLQAPLQALHVNAPELEFWLPSAALDVARLDALAQQHLLPGTPRPPLPARLLRGLLMGFADLVFEHDGRWWVLDYKSNALGAHDGAYRAPMLAAAMAQHRYDVQAALYMTALHRLLRARLGTGYDPGRHLGGAVYLFLRGIAGPARGCVWLPAVPALLDGIDAMLGGPGSAGGNAA